MNRNFLFLFLLFYLNILAYIDIICVIGIIVLIRKYNASRGEKI